jgi:hypothetical protein
LRLRPAADLRSVSVGPEIELISPTTSSYKTRLVRRSVQS